MNYVTRLENVLDALADYTDLMTDKEVIQEVIDDGLDPDVIAEETRGVLLRAVEKVEEARNG